MEFDLCDGRPESTWSCHSGPRRQSGRERPIPRMAWSRRFAFFREQVRAHAPEDDANVFPGQVVEQGANGLRRGKVDVGDRWECRRSDRQKGCANVRRHRIAAALGEGRIFPTLHEALDAIRAEGAPLPSLEREKVSPERSEGGRG